MDKSPWNAYGRRQDQSEEGAASTGRHDRSSAVSREVMLTHEQLRQYLSRTLQEFNEIRAGRAGYVRMVAEALKPPPQPESIEETLRRLSGASPQKKDRGAPPRAA